MRRYVTRVAGSTVTAVDELLMGARIVINWHGGWHHGQPDEADGYGYI